MKPFQVFQAVLLAGLGWALATPGQAVAQAKPLVDTLVAQEKDLFEAWKKRDLAAVKNALPDDYLEVNPFFGRMNKTQLLQDLYPHLLISKFAIADARVMQPTKNTALLTYQLTIEGKFKDNDASGRSLITSLYVNRGNRWVLVFVQMTDPPAAKTGMVALPQERTACLGSGPIVHPRRPGHGPSRAAVDGGGAGERCLLNLV